MNSLILNKPVAYLYICIQNVSLLKIFLLFFMFSYCVYLETILNTKEIYGNHWGKVRRALCITLCLQICSSLKWGLQSLNNCPSIFLEGNFWDSYNSPTCNFYMLSSFLPVASQLLWSVSSKLQTHLVWTAAKPRDLQWTFPTISQCNQIHCVEN